MPALLLLQAPVTTYPETGTVSPFWVAFGLIIALGFLVTIAWLLGHLNPKGPWLR